MNKMEPHSHGGRGENRGDSIDLSCRSDAYINRGKIFAMRKQHMSVDTDSSSMGPGHHNTRRENCGSDVESLNSAVNKSSDQHHCVRIKQESVDVSDSTGRLCHHRINDGGNDVSDSTGRLCHHRINDSGHYVNDSTGRLCHHRMNDGGHDVSDSTGQHCHHGTAQELKLSDVLYHHSEKKVNRSESSSVMFDKRSGICVRIKQEPGVDQEDCQPHHQPSGKKCANTVDHIQCEAEKQDLSREPVLHSEYFVKFLHHTAGGKTAKGNINDMSDPVLLETERHGIIKDPVLLERHEISLPVIQEPDLDQEHWETVHHTRKSKVADIRNTSSPLSFDTENERHGTCVEIKVELESVEDHLPTSDLGRTEESLHSMQNCSDPVHSQTSTAHCSVKGHNMETKVQCAGHFQWKTIDGRNTHLTSGIEFKELKSETWPENPQEMYGSIKINPSSAAVVGFQKRASECSDESDSDTLPVHFQATEESVGSNTLYECTMCQLTFSLPAQLHEHVVDHDADNRHYSCAQCHISFHHLSLLTQHVVTHTLVEGSELQYDNQKSFVCHVCSKVFRRLYELNRHQKIHSGSKPFVCDVCHKAFARGDELNRHKRVHSGVKPYQCDQCNRAFITNHELSQHKKSHAESKPFECPLCSRGFLRADKLFHHEQMHAGLRSFECDVCPKAFITQSELNQHKKIHSGMKPFVCEVCCKAYLKVNDLNRHMKMHTGQKPFVCDTCGKAFHRADILSRHKKIHTRQKRNKHDI